jgi:hypothetical protein
MKALLLFSALAGASLASGLDAQVTPPKDESGCTKPADGRVECRVYRSGVPGDSLGRRSIFYKMDSAMANRAALGLELRTTGTKRDTLGVFVDAVTPKGPAETAGIVEGDRIAAINGVDLRTTVADTEDSYTNGLASHRLSREVEKLTPGARVTLRVYSGGRLRDVQVTAGKASEVMRLGGGFGYRMPMNGMMEFNGPRMKMLAPDMQFFREQMPMMKERLEPMLRQNLKEIEPRLREKLRDLPEKIRLRTAPGTRMRVLDDVDFDEPFAFEMDEEPFVLDLDDEPFDFDFENEIQSVSPEEIRELAATAVRDARAALSRLVADGIA